MNRRSFIENALLSSMAIVSGLAKGDAAVRKETPASNQVKPGSELSYRWARLDNAIQSWWDGDLHSATEEEIQTDPAKTLLFLPYPYSTAGGSEAAFPEMYGWDTQFINQGLLAHERSDIVRNNILNQIFMIERYGEVLNGNRTFYKTRGQPPLLAWSVETYLAINSQDDELAMRAYPSLERSYTGYWNGPTHRTPIGLSTCHDGGRGSENSLELASEAEAGLDYTPIFDGDIHRCVPLHVNAALVKQAQVLAQLAERFSWRDKVEHWKKEASDRSQAINHYCWDENKGFYFEYDFVRKMRLPFYSLNAYWPLWIGVASKRQAERAAENLHLFDRAYGLTFTDKPYRNPHPEFQNLEWAYPESWPPEQMIVAQALQRYGFEDQARDINRKYIDNVVTTWEKTGLTWERYNAVDGGQNCPIERTPVAKLHGWSSSSAVVLGRMLFNQNASQLPHS